MSMPKVALLVVALAITASAQVNREDTTSVGGSRGSTAEGTRTGSEARDSRTGSGGRTSGESARDGAATSTGRTGEVFVGCPALAQSGCEQATECVWRNVKGVAACYGPAAAPTMAPATYSNDALKTCGNGRCFSDTPRHNASAAPAVVAATCAEPSALTAHTGGAVAPNGCNCRASTTVRSDGFTFPADACAADPANGNLICYVDVEGSCNATTDSGSAHGWVDCVGVSNTSSAPVENTTECYKMNGDAKVYLDCQTYQPIAQNQRRLLQDDTRECYTQTDLQKANDEKTWVECPDYNDYVPEYQNVVTYQPRPLANYCSLAMQNSETAAINAYNAAHAVWESTEGGKAAMVVEYETNNYCQCDLKCMELGDCCADFAWWCSLEDTLKMMVTPSGYYDFPYPGSVFMPEGADPNQNYPLPVANGWSAPAGCACEAVTTFDDVMFPAACAANSGDVYCYLTDATSGCAGASSSALSNNKHVYCTNDNAAVEQVTDSSCYVVNADMSKTYVECGNYGFDDTVDQNTSVNASSCYTMLNDVKTFIDCADTGSTTTQSNTTGSTCYTETNGVQTPVNCSTYGNTNTDVSSGSRCFVEDANGTRTPVACGVEAQTTDSGSRTCITRDENGVETPTACPDSVNTTGSTSSDAYTYDADGNKVAWNMETNEPMVGTQ